MPRFVVFAYGCEPDKGSEPGAGWIWSRMIARLGETWVITRENNRASIEEHLRKTPERHNLRFVYVDLPPWARFWKRRNKGARLYYLLWQAAALFRARELHREVRFDANWHLTWANVWIGSMAALLPGPFVYGPVGGGISMSWRLSPTLGIRGTLFEAARAAARWGARYGNPLARISWRRARLILVQNPETEAWLPRRHRAKAVPFPNAVIERIPSVPVRRTSGVPFTALYAGRLVPLKGLTLGLRALRDLPDWRLVICGGGPDEGRLRRLAQKLGVDGRVDFLGWLTRNEVSSQMGKADLFLFPSLHDEGPFAVAEALAEGLPVVCLDRGSAPLLGATAVSPTGISETVRALRQAMEGALGSQPAPFPTMDARTEALRRVLDEHLPSRGTSPDMDPMSERGLLKQLRGAP